MRRIDFSAMAQEIESLNDYIRDRVVCMYLVKVFWRDAELGVDVCWNRGELLWVYEELLGAADGGDIPNLRVKVWTDDSELPQVSGLWIERCTSAVMREMFCASDSTAPSEEYEFWVSKNWP